MSSCLKNDKAQDEISIKERGTKKYKIDSTPTVLLMKKIH